MEAVFSHPERDLIVSRYLKRQRSLASEALARLIPDEADDLEESNPISDDSDALRPLTLHDQRILTIIEVLRSLHAKRVLDLGCGEGKLLRHLLAEPQFEAVGMDVSWRSLELASERLKLDHLAGQARTRLQLLQGSLVYRDQRLSGFDAAAVVEVIEHLDAARLASFERALFEFVRPTHVVLTTPNAEYNAVFETLPTGQLRHSDHRFEWTRAQFELWANTVATRFQYTVRFEPVCGRLRKSNGGEWGIRTPDRTFGPITV